MSTNFTGVTFAMQKVAPTDDAIVRRAILPDGILSGCELSYSGSTLTMAAGQLMICGRQIRHPAAQNWAVVDATTGYARLLLTIDLTRTSTKEVFDQVVDTIEYASSEDGFPDLEQADINGAGTRYQVVACVVSLGTGGITGVVSQLAPSVVSVPTGLEMKLLWENASPTSAFAAQTIALNLDEYDAIEVYLCASVDYTSKEFPARIKKGKYTAVQTVDNVTYTEEYMVVANRNCTANADGVAFADCVMSAMNAKTYTTKNERLIPVRIFGIKGVTA